MVPQLDFTTITDLAEAKKYWDLLVSPGSIFDDWNFRYCFYKYFNYPIIFIVGFHQMQPVGLLALQRNTDSACIEFFGGTFMENNRVYCLPENSAVAPQFYQHLKKEKKILQYITPQFDPEQHGLTVLNHLYFLPLQDWQSSHDYLQASFSSETRGKMLRKIKKILPHDIQVTRNNFSDIEFLFQYNKNRFQEDSMFLMAHREQIFRDLLHLPFSIFLNSFFLDHTRQGVALGIKYLDEYVFISYGLSPEAFPNFATYLKMHIIDQAIQEHAKTINASIGDCGWKESWRFEKRPLFILKST